MNEDDGGWKMEEGWKYGKKQRVKERSRFRGGTRMQQKVSERLAGAFGRTADWSARPGPPAPLAGPSLEGLAGLASLALVPSSA